MHHLFLLLYTMIACMHAKIVGAKKKVLKSNTSSIKKPQPSMTIETLMMMAMIKTRKRVGADFIFEYVLSFVTLST